MTTAEKSALRARAQTLKPTLHVGKGGITPALIKELDTALKKKDLVKVRFTEGRETLRAQCDELALGTKSECAGGIGRVAAFYRPLPAGSTPRGE